MTSKNYICLITGALAGFIVGAIFMKDKYKKIADEEVTSVIQEFSNSKKENRNDDKKTAFSSKATTVNHIQYNGQSSHKASNINELQAEAIRANYNTAFEEPRTPTKLDIEQIDENEFGNAEDEAGVPYRRDTLFYYIDDVIANSDNDKMPVNDEIIGRPFITDDDWKKGGDALYFRNHILHMDIEVLRSLKSFEEIKRTEQFYEEE